MIRIYLIGSKAGLEVITLQAATTGWSARGKRLTPTPQPELDDIKYVLVSSEREISQDDWIIARYLFSVASDVPRLDLSADLDAGFRLEWAGPAGSGCISLPGGEERVDLAFRWMRDRSGLPDRRFP